MSDAAARARYFLDTLGIDLYVRRDLPLAAPHATAASGGVADEPPPPWDLDDGPAAVTPTLAKPVTDTAPPRVTEPPPRQPSTPSVEGQTGARTTPPPLFDDLNPPPIDEVPGFIDEDGDDPYFPDLPPAKPAPPPVATLDWTALKERVASCQACSELVANRTQTVFGVGNQTADWLIIGEAPGADEDAQGEPFVGRAGQLLNRMLVAIGLKREEVYIANVLKCRPPNNRDPHSDEAAHCEPYLQRQIALIKPKVILIVGRIAAQKLLQSDAPVGKLRGLHRYGETPVVVTYHPAYLLRSPLEKRKSWDDLRLALKVTRGEIAP